VAAENDPTYLAYQAYLAHLTSLHDSDIGVAFRPLPDVRVH
jgi:hypothetical protein